MPSNPEQTTRPKFSSGVSEEELLQAVHLLYFQLHCIRQLTEAQRREPGYYMVEALSLGKKLLDKYPSLPRRPEPVSLRLPALPRLGKSFHENKPMNLRELFRFRVEQVEMFDTREGVYFVIRDRFMRPKEWLLCFYLILRGKPQTMR